MSGNVDPVAMRFINGYFPAGSMCRRDRCEHYRRAEDGCSPWCWLESGIGAEGREPECPAFRRGNRPLPHRLGKPGAAK